jgi:hypothetical protein
MDIVLLVGSIRHRTRSLAQQLLRSSFMDGHHPGNPATLKAKLNPDPGPVCPLSVALFADLFCIASG